MVVLVVLATAHRDLAWLGAAVLTVLGVAAKGARLPRAGVVAGAGAGGVAVLLARSYGRAEEIHRAMLARSFPGYFRPLSELHLHRSDVVFLAYGVLTPVALRLLIERAA